MVLVKLVETLLVTLNKIPLNGIPLNKLKCMKNLKNYIKDYINESYLNESVWDIEDNIEDDNEESILNNIKKFIEDNCINIKLNHCKIVFDKKKDKYIVNCDQHVYLSPNTEQLTNGMFEWDVVEGDFDCANCPELESLEGAPKKVGRHFNCSGCPKLTSLKGAPKVVKWDFICSHCPKLSSLDGIGKVGGNIISDIK